ncbi:molybdopterin biosynthesis protein [Defluviimonas sp. 20V17]|uniref:Molybdenum cofactor cytidylyltransferase n=1 Tax=Allgaiera indica TaxID=765699 RepID=A0AAN4USA1_9RHOB|nr:molybdopterin-binding protein [Allgaiera indica]KDB04615.1 molybdopterin biosynthesis protein [Defluviimonas sp. 20V17]GHE02601.1 molybdopterin biosynthesis protein [Allgaiera indica]SDX85099.1 molybdenum cofactor cytidylyltransferase [Allgaiera indica]
MRFGPVPIDQAEGAILAHSEALAGRKLKKGRVLTAADLAAFRDAGATQLTVARLDPGDVPEDAAATRLAAALVPDAEAAGLTLSPAFTGRVNIKAARPGLVALDPGAIRALNLIDPALTLATLAPLTRVPPGALVGTVKIISYAIGEDTLSRAEQAARAALSLHPVTRRTAGLLLSELPDQPAKISAKARRVTDQRLQALGVELIETRATAHEAGAMAEALAEMRAEMLLILTASATSDAHDTGPDALARAGGTLTRFGMPVDPGNLLFLGRLGTRPVIGLPGCARSPALNGADWVLERIACGLDPTSDDIAAMGVGGLLKEIPQRPQPREG